MQEESEGGPVFRRAFWRQYIVALLVFNTAQANIITKSAKAVERAAWAATVRKRAALSKCWTVH